MDNHVHLLLRPADPRQLSRIMAGLLVAYVRAYQRRTGSLSLALTSKAFSQALGTRLSRSA
jgi:REP element-mobilizing transposase RayT